VTRILVIDDEANLRHTLGYALRQERFEVIGAADGEAGLEVFRTSEPDLVVLDLMLPKIDGLEVCRRIRRTSGVPILMLTARDSEFDKVVGLEIGADDYLVKPFSVRELVARVRAMLRRASRPPESATADTIRARGLTIDEPRHRVTVGDREVDLKPKEFDLLLFLARHPGQVFSREQLLQNVWGGGHLGDSRTVDTHVKTLRERLGESAGTPHWIETLRGVGYRFKEDRQPA